MTFHIMISMAFHEKLYGPGGGGDFTAVKNTNKVCGNGNGNSARTQQHLCLPREECIISDVKDIFQDY